MPAQGELFIGLSFGARCRELLQAEVQQAGRLKWDRVEVIIEEELERTFPKQKRLTLPNREVLFSALCAVCNITEGKATKKQKVLIGSSLAGIVKATPNLTVEELQRVARLLARKYPGAVITPRSLELHWGEFPPPRQTEEDRPTDPENWRDRFIAAYPDMTLPDHYKFSDLPANMQEKVKATEL